MEGKKSYVRLEMEITEFQNADGTVNLVEASGTNGRYNNNPGNVYPVVNP